MIICKDLTFKFYFHPGIQTLKKKLLDVLDENVINEITYKYWISKSRTSLEIFVKY